MSQRRDYEIKGCFLLARSRTVEVTLSTAVYDAICNCMQHTSKWDHCYVLVVFPQENQTKPKTKSSLTSRGRCLIDKMNQQPLKGF